PSGVSLSPSLNSDGALTGCTDAQFDVATTTSSPACPTASKIGSTAISTTSIGALTGQVYLASTAPGHIARVFLHAQGVDYPSVHVKLVGTVDVDASTGTTTATFTNAPEVPFSEFDVTFQGGTTPALTMPRTCGTPAGSASLAPYTGAAAATANATLTINASCADSTTFAPTLGTTISPTKAGATSTLTTTVTVPERNRYLDHLVLNLPGGLLANINGAPRCSIADANASACAAATKIGSVTAKAGQGTTPGTFTGSLYLTDSPAPGDVVGIAVDLPAVVGPVDLGHVVTIADVTLRPADYGIDVTANVPTDVKGIPLVLRSLTLTVDKAGFLTNPASCSASTITSSLHGVGGSTATPSVPFTATNCDQLGFSPTVAFTGAPAAAGGASAFTTKITAPASAPGSEQAALKKAVVDLPTGVSLSASINSDGTLAGCTDTQFAQTSFADPTCPAGSAIGTSRIDVPQVGTLTGNVYLAQTTPSGAIAGLFLDAKSSTFDGVRVKLAGRVDVDATTRKTTATFDNAPAVAFTNLELTLRGGTAPAISMPRTCGTPSGTATLTPQTGTAVTRTGTLTVNANCGNDTAFGATGAIALGTTAAGQSTSLTTTITVPAANRELAKVGISLPAGLLANIDGAPRCSVADANNGACAAATQIGTIDASAGQGTAPGGFSGKAYLVDAPSSDDIVGIGLSIPVVVGPVNLGAVNVIADVKLRSDYGIDIAANVPTQIKGIPMYLRGLKIAITKSGFLFNPSTCGDKTTTMQMTSASYAGATSTANASLTTTIDSCGSLAFTPSVAFSASPSSAGGASAFTTTITVPAGAQSALKSASVQLPTGVSLSPSIDSAGTLTGCTDAQFTLATPSTAPTCPAASKIGATAIATTSVGALTGDVYLSATGSGHLARVLVYAGSAAYPGARVKMVGTVDVDPSTGIATAFFDNAPQVPFTSFAITFQGGTAPALTMPRTCGTPSGSASLQSYAGGAAVNKTATLTIDQNCGSST
ncbi:MAG: hypothetical protein REI11_20890, partial [Patulibacter sp.]|nr:hypothetical protein [Patulibacter sp.]